MLIFLMSVHVLAAIVGLGPTFTFAFTGVMSEKRPAAAHALQETVHMISTRLVVPLVVILGLSGIGLVAKTKYNLSTNAWLGAGIVLYVLVLAAALFYQLPTQKKVLALLGSGKGMDNPEVRKLANGQKFVGIAMGVSVLMVTVLMIWKPGLTA